MAALSQGRIVVEFVRRRFGACQVSIALLVMYMWAHGMSWQHSFDQGTAILMQPKNGLAPVGNLCPAGASCYPTVMVTEPQDVPAVQADPKWMYANRDDTPFLDGFREGCVHSGGYYFAAMKACKYLQQTCKDKRRILLTAEDGSKWCHKVSR